MMERFSENELDEGLDLSRIESGIERSEIVIVGTAVAELCEKVERMRTEAAEAHEAQGENMRRLAYTLDWLGTESREMRCAVEECSEEMRRSAAAVEKVLAADLPGMVWRGMKEAGEVAEDAARAIGRAAEKAVQSLAGQQREATNAIAEHLKNHREFIEQQQRDNSGIHIPASFFYAMVNSLIFLAAFLAVTMFANHGNLPHRQARNTGVGVHCNHHPFQWRDCLALPPIRLGVTGKYL